MATHPAADPHRPLFHFSPARGWMNDPIPFFHDGAYHVFFQHNPGAAVWGDMHWGHAVSRDLVRWEERPIALAPTPGGPDADGVFTGCVVARGGAFRALYTGIPRLHPLEQVQCLASSPDLARWDKDARSPFLAAPPPGFGPCFRDPHVWSEGDSWRMIVGGERPDRLGGTAFLYRSHDLAAWEYGGPLVLCETQQTGHECECPDLFPLGDRHVFLSSSGRTWWQTGAYDGHAFTPKRVGPADGEAFYAAKTLVDDGGRRLLFGWLREGRAEADQVAAGWSGVLSLPRVLSLLPDGALGFAPPPELAALRGRHHHFENLTVAEGVRVLDGVRSDTLEVRAQFAPGDAAGAGLSVRCAPDGADGVDLLYPAPTSTSMTHQGLSLHVYVDRSVVETFIGGRACDTRRAYPDAPDRRHVALCARGGAARALSVDVWELRAGTTPA